MIWGILVIALGILGLVCAFFAGLESYDCIPVKRLMVVQHFGADEFAQLVDLSMLEEYGFAKLDQYFIDVPFEEEEMLEAGFRQSKEDDVTYWKVVRDTELIRVLNFKSYYWIWGRDEYDE